MDLEIRERVFLITGGTDGLGLALATTLMSEGAFVAVCGRDESRLARAREILGGNALVKSCDVTNNDELDGFIDETLATFGRLDGAVNNAGRAMASPVATSSDELWRDDFALKVLAAVHVSRRVLPVLAETQGSILNVLAISARSPQGASTPTSASRAAGLALTKALAHEGGPLGVRANAILIGLIESGQWARRAQAAGVSPEEFYASMARDVPIPLGRLGKAREFADVAAFLLSPRASYLTGVGLSVDGGLSPVI
ncbi:MAG TPA: SDR family oxidoreductase [Acidimicrobiales bacterium]|nr:SDR family oxidoreductase [Acidimicrobiales bacterium]